MSKRIVSCYKHGKQPMVRVCKHLAAGANLKWCPHDVVDGREVEHDWACPSCLSKMKQLTDNTIRELCIVCLRTLQHQKEA